MANDERRTPPAVYRQLDRCFHFDMDTAATNENALAEAWYVGPCTFDPEDNDCVCGLCYDWHFNRVFVNPPYSNIGPWVDKAITESQAYGATVVMLVPADTSARWFQRAWSTATEWMPATKRIQFRLADGSKDGGAKQPSGLFIWHPGILTPHSTPRVRYWTPETGSE